MTGPARTLPARAPDADVFPILQRGWPADGFGPIAIIAAQLPDPAELPDGAVVVVRQTGPRPRGLRRWLALWGKPRKVHAAVRCTALLARGYLEVSSSLDPKTGEVIVWGLAATSGRSSSAP